MTTPAYQRNGQPTSPAQFYAVACDPHRNVAVEACAGAGKTWMLVSRILRALLDGAAAHEILAITFTKKAAAEMRQRLTEWLQDFAHATPEQLLQELTARGLDGPQAQALCEPLRQLYTTLLRAGRPVQIRTFHSWFAALLRAAPMAVLQDMGLPSNYELLEDDAPAVDLLWRRFYATLLTAAENDASLKHDFEAVVATHGRVQTQKALTAALARRVEFALADAAGKVQASVPHYSALFADLVSVDALATPDASPAPLALLVSEPLRSQLSLVAQILGRATQASFSAKGGELELALSQGDATGVLAALLTTTGTARKFSEKVAGIERVRAAQEQVLRVNAAQAQHQAWLYQQRMTRLTRLLVAEFAALKRERGWVDMNDIETAALRLLADPVLGGWMQERLDARVRHLLIDEFQDTNPLQWQALHAWLSSYAGTGGGGPAPSVFIVGDPKQSIYRFRRAEPQVFIAAQAFVQRELSGDLLSCDHTRRNAPEVIALVNQVMVQAQSDAQFSGFRPHTTASEISGAVLHLPQILRDLKEPKAPQDSAWRDSLTTPREQPEETLRTLECRQVARYLAQQIEQGLHPRDIMVLARKRSRLRVMQEELRSLSIPAQQPETTDLAQAPEVQDIAALLDALVSPAHDLSLARALKSPLFGVSDEALVQLATLHRAQAERPVLNASLDRPSRHKPARTSWLDLLQSAASVSDALAHSALPAELRAAGAQLSQWQALLATLPPHDALAAIYQQGDVLARFGAAAPTVLRAGVLANLQALLAATLELDGGRYVTPYALVRALKAGGIKAPARSDADAVALLTVHGAKGLEAELVLLLDSDTPSPNAQSMGVLVDNPGAAPTPQLFTFLASESDAPSSAAIGLELEVQARQREELNGLYVAMTRARQRLVLSSVQPHREAGLSWWQRLVPGSAAITVPGDPLAPAVVGAADAADAVAGGAGVQLAQMSSFSLPVLPALLRANPPPVAAGGACTTPATASTSAASLLGQAMHRLLEWAELGACEVPATQVQRVASEFGLDRVQAGRAADMAQRILGGEGAWAWDPAQVTWAGNEVSLTVQGAMRRIDRLVQRRAADPASANAGGAKEWWVLDYKSATQPQQHLELQAQLRSYRAAVQALYPTDVVRAAFLTAHGTLLRLP